ncbi:MAG: DNA-3-methyladenine glycosylase [Alphaproteobacteria bacterium]|nr:DNA-3-methyladenine glycosylase [Alphaproteobacteria bacterium]
MAQKTLLGAYLCSTIEGHLTIGKITELEVYTGGEDKASHTYQNKRTPRTEPIFKSGGHAYIFLVYGMYHQFCIVVCEENNPCCILIRSVEPILGINIMQERRKIQNLKHLTNGPAKVCQAFGITRELSGINLLTGPIWICPKTDSVQEDDIISTPRIGVDYAKEYAHKKWRFLLKDNPFISKK